MTERKKGGGRPPPIQTKPPRVRGRAMTDKEPRLVRDMTHDRPPFGEWMTEARLAEILARNYKTILERTVADISLPDPVEWTILAGMIRNFQREPWSNQSAGIMTAGVRRQQKERATLDAAAKILEADAKRFFQRNEEWQRRYAEAIQMLRMHRGAADNRRNHVSKIAARGPAMTGWAYTAREIMAWVVTILMRHHIPVSPRRTSPLVNSLREILGFIYQPHELPSAATLSKVAKEYVDG